MIPTYRVISRKFHALTNQFAIAEEMIEGNLLVSDGCLEFSDEEGVVSSVYPNGAWLTCERVSVIDQDISPIIETSGIRG